VERGITFFDTAPTLFEQISAEKLIAAYEQTINRAHAKGIKVIGAMLLPIQNSRKDEF
jgi:hypothetical protein